MFFFLVFQQVAWYAAEVHDYSPEEDTITVFTKEFKNTCPRCNREDRQREYQTIKSCYLT